MLENNVKEIIRYVTDGVRAVCRQLVEQRPAIGYLFILREHQEGEPEVVLSTPIGESPDATPEQWSRYRRNAREKAERLHRLPLHLNSWQSRSEQHNRFGGAIRVGAYILSFSGLPQEEDEKQMLLLALRLELLRDLDEARSVASPPALAILNFRP